MHHFLIVLSCIILVNGISGASLQLASSIDEDAIEIARLLAKVQSSEPAIFQKLEPSVYCQVIDKCCGDEQRSQAISLFFPSLVGVSTVTRFDEVINACVNLTTLTEANKWCPSFHQLIISSEEVDHNPDVKQYFTVMNKYGGELESIFDDTDAACNNEEMHAIICRSNKKLIETCFGKMLRQINYRDGNETYKTFIMKIKQMLMNIHQQLSQISAKDSNTIEIQ